MSKVHKDRLEVSSDQLKGELVEIKDRLAALETIASLANRQVVEGYVRDCIISQDAKRILVACEQAKTKDELRALLSYSSSQALDHHLKPLRESDLLQTAQDDAGKLTFCWSNLFRRLPKQTVSALLAVGSTAKKAKPPN